MADNEIGAKIILSAEDRNASSTVKAVAQETSNLGAATDKARDAGGKFTAGQQAAATATTATARALELLNADLKAASPAQLQAVEAELKQLAQSGQLAEKELAQVNAKLKAIGEEGGSRLKGILGGIGSELESLAQKIPGVSQLGGVAGAAVPEVAALAAAVSLAVAALKAFSEKQEHTVKLDTALQQSGQLTDEYREKLQALAGQYGKLQGGSTVWLDTFTRLTQFGADSSNIGKYAEGIKNLAATMDGDVAGASVAFTRAMTGHYRELEMLGFQIDKTLPKQQQLESLLAQFAERGGGQAENRAKTLAASFERLEHAGGNFLPTLGRIIDQMTGVGPVMDLWAKGLNFAGWAIGGVTPKLEGMSNKIPTLEQRLHAAAKGAGDAGEAMEDGLAKGADAAKDSTENLAQYGLEKLSAAFQKLSQDARDAIKALDDAKRRADALDDAQLGEDLAKIKAGPGTDDEKAKAEREARERSTGRKEKRQDETDAGKVAALEQEAKAKRFAAGRLSVPAAEADRAVRDNEARQKQILDQLAPAAQQERQDLENHLSKPIGKVGGYADGFAAAAAQQRAEDLDQQMKAWQEEVTNLQKAMPQLEAVAAVNKQVADKAQADASAATLANRAQEKAIADEQQSRHAVQDRQRATRKIDGAADDRRRDAEASEQVRQEKLKRVNEALKQPGLTVAQRQDFVDQRGGLETESDRYHDRNVAAPVRAERTVTRQRDRAARDAQDTGGGSAVVDDARGLAGILPAGAPGGLNNQALKLAQQIIAEGGKNAGHNEELKRLLDAILANMVQTNQATNALQADLSKYKTDVENLKRSANRP